MQIIHSILQLGWDCPYPGPSNLGLSTCYLEFGLKLGVILHFQGLFVGLHNVTFIPVSTSRKNRSPNTILKIVKTISFYILGLYVVKRKRTWVTWVSEWIYSSNHDSHHRVFQSRVPKTDYLIQKETGWENCVWYAPPPLLIRPAPLPNIKSLTTMGHT